MRKHRKNKGDFLILALFLIFVLSSLNSAFAQRGRFIGEVTDEEGNPIEGAVIVATNPNAMIPKVELKTDEDGKFIFFVRDTGVWRFEVTADGYHNFIVDMSLSALKNNPSYTFVLKKMTADEEISGSVVEIELFNKGKELYDTGDYQGALTLFEDFSQKNPDVYLIHYNIALCHQELKEYEKALEDYQKFLEKRPDHATTYYKMGQCYIGLEQFDKALESFEKTVELNPDDPNTYYNVAEVYFYTDYLEEAVKYYLKSIELKPDFVDSYLKLGYTYLKLEDKPNTIKYLEKYLELNPTSDQAELIKNLIEQLKEGQ